MAAAGWPEHRARVTLDRAELRTITVDHETRDGAAVAGADYTAKSGTLTFTVGQRSKTVLAPPAAPPRGW